MGWDGMEQVMVKGTNKNHWLHRMAERPRRKGGQRASKKTATGEGQSHTVIDPSLNEAGVT